MKINIISLGSFKDHDPYKELFSEYSKRIKWDIKLIEIKDSKKYNNINERKIYEGEQILKKVNKNNKLIVLDERGENISTHKFASKLNNFAENGYSADFIIGGSYGLSQNIIDRADLVLSFGNMVFPHLMVRIMLIEQLYRIYTINNNHPYHR